MKLTDHFDVPADVVAREVGGETMLLDLASGTYFGLDEVGAKVWQTLEDGRSPAQACDAIFAAYEVERDILECDVLALLEQLLESGLITVR